MIRDEDLLLLTKLKSPLHVLDKARQKIADAKGRDRALRKMATAVLEARQLPPLISLCKHGLIGTIPSSDTDAVRSSP